MANGFQTLEPATAYTYLVTAHWSPEAQSRYTFLNLADETVAIEWPVPLKQAELSDKDRQHPRLAEVAPVPAAPLLILGAAGQLGRALVAVCQRRGIAHRTFERADCDIKAPCSWPLAELETARAVLNASAFTAVDEAETAEGRARAWQVNATAVGALAAACRDHDVPLAHVSTDYVFDGSLPLDQKHAPEHLVAPLSAYGQSKAAGEAAERTWAKHWIVRTSWVIGDGANFVRIIASLAERGIDPAVVDDQHGRLTFAEDLADVLLELVVEQAPYGTRHVTSGGPAMSWFEEARGLRADGPWPAAGEPRQHGGVLPGPSCCGAASQELAAGSRGVHADLARAAGRLHALSGGLGALARHSSRWTSSHERGSRGPRGARRPRGPQATSSGDVPASSDCQAERSSCSSRAPRARQ